mmetsp:Transcript_17607/g.38132  ORF Transcript_17607/g.38132 Transcript_17607/m.38132 type:complete len:227 (+) Transcript_17607:1508-2188(+)
MLGKYALNVVQGVLVEEHLGPSCLLVVEDRDGHAPGSLAGNAPVTAGFYKGVDAILSHIGNPLNRIHRLQRLFPKALHAREPLVRRPEDSRLLRPPVVRVLVPVVLRPDQRPRLLQRLNHGRVPFPQNTLSHEIISDDSGGSSLDGEPSHVVDWGEQVQAVLEASEVILLTMTRGRVDKASAGLGGDVISAGDDGGEAIIERVLVGRADEGGAREGGQDVKFFALW